MGAYDSPRVVGVPPVWLRTNCTGACGGKRRSPAADPWQEDPREGPLTSGIIHISYILSPSRAPPISGSPHATGTTLYQTQVARRTNIRAVAQKVLGFQAIPRSCIAHRGMLSFSFGPRGLLRHQYLPHTKGGDAGLFSSPTGPKTTQGQHLPL